MAFPATSERKIYFGYLLRHHPQRVHIAAIWTKSKTTVFRADDWSYQARLKQVFKVLGGEGRGLIVVSGTGRKLLTGQLPDAINQRLTGPVELTLRLDDAT